MARRSQCSSAGDNPLDPNYLPPHYREEYRIAIDALVEEDLEGYYKFLQKADVVDFLSTPEIQYIQGSVQVPLQSHHPEQQFLETEGDGSSDTYWPLHSDLEVPGLDLGWPQLHHFIGPTEVTTLVNPPEPDMPSIKEQARRLIKNAQQVIAVVMDMFTDVDIFADILNAAMRSVAVYIILDEQNAHHFLNMASNCRVNLQSIQFLRVRTVSGITYHCRSGKSFKGQLMDRFLFTDCRAVLSGNYSFMWSFEKLHRCMAHLFLGQFVSTFDEEFRILFAQSEPLMTENVLGPMDDFGPLLKRQYPSERTCLYREPRKFLSLDTSHPEERIRHPHDERMDVDWRMMHLKRQEFLQGPADMYTRPPPQQSRMDLPYDQGPPRINTMENPGFKRHSYAEGVHGRFSYPFLQQQGIPDPDIQGRQFHRGQQQYPGPITGPETDYSSYDKFWSQDYQSADQYSEPVLPQEMQPPDNFDPVHNYLSSTRNVDFDQSSEKLLPVADLPFSSSHPRRLSFSQLYGCQTSPTPSNPTDQKQFFQEPTTDRKDPSVKRGLRNWRISSYLSAYDNPGDEGLPLAPPQAGEPFEEPLIPTQQTAPVIDLSLPKIPNVREFKVPAVPRASQLPTYIKSTVREQPKKLPDEPTAVAVEITTPSPSESSSTAEGEKVEEAEPKEPKITALQMEKSFRRKYNVTTPRSSRLRSSLIFSSLDQQHSQDSKTAQGQQDEDSDKNEAEQTKLPFMSQVLGQRRSTTREPFEWSRYIKSATTDNSATETPDTDDGNSKADGENTSKVEDSKDPSENCGLQESLQPPDVELANSSPSTPRTKPSEAELPKTDQPLQVPKLLFTTPYVDMSDPDTRLMFFKELAAKRKAAKAAEAEKSQVKAQMTPVDLKKGTTVKMEECEPKEASEKLVATASPSEGLSEKNVATDDAGKIVSAAECESVSLSLESSDRTQDQAGLVKNDPCTSQSCKEEQTTVSTESENKEQKNSQPATALPVSVETESHPKSECHEDIMLTKPAVNESGPTYPPTSAISNIATVSSLEQGANESEIPSCDSTSKESSSLTPHLVEVPPPSASAVLISYTQNLQQELLDTRISEPAPEQSEQLTESELRCSDPSVQSSSAKHIPNTDPRPQISSSSQILSMTIHSTPEETSCSNVTPEHSRSTHFPSALSQNYDKAEALETVSPLAPSELSQTVDKTSAESELLQAHVEPVSQLSSAETPPPNDGSACAESHFSANICAAPTEPKTSSSQSTTKTTSEDSCAHTPSEYVLDVLKSENSSLPKTIVEATEVLGSSEDVKSENTPPSHCLSSLEPGVTKASDLEMSPSLPEQFGILDLHLPSDDIPSDTCSSVIPDITNETDQSTSNGSTQDTLTHATPPSEPNLTGSVTVTPVKTETPSSPLTESVEPVLSPEADKTETSISTKCSPLHTLSLPEQFTADSNETSVLCSTETLLPTEPTSEIPTEPEPTPDSVISESCDPEPSEPAETSKIDQQNEISEEPELSDSDEITPEDIESTNKVNSSLKQESVIRENTNNQIKPNICSKLAEITSNELVPPPSQSKLPKTSQSRYQSSTANVLSSSNLRDDTKLLLEQISANSQSRNEATKESPVTDDEKEDEADKNAKRENERGMRTFIRGPPQSTQEREKLLERIQSMRKERKVYSRFEMAP